MKNDIDFKKMFVKLADYDDAYNIPYNQFVKAVAKEVVELMRVPKELMTDSNLDHLEGENVEIIELGIEEVEPRGKSPKTEVKQKVSKKKNKKKSKKSSRPVGPDSGLAA